MMILLPGFGIIPAASKVRSDGVGELT